MNKYGGSTNSPFCKSLHCSHHVHFHHPVAFSSCHLQIVPQKWYRVCSTTDGPSQPESYEPTYQLTPVVKASRIESGVRDRVVKMHYCTHNAAGSNLYLHFTCIFLHSCICFCQVWEIDTLLSFISFQYIVHCGYLRRPKKGPVSLTSVRYLPPHQCF